MCSLEKRGNHFFLTITGRDGDEEHRLNSTIISSIRSALSDAKSRSTPGSFLVTVTQGKYFSNGFDLNPADFSSQKSSNNKVLPLIAMFKLLVSDLISFPMPTIAVVTGHAVGAGLGLAISHDYVLMTRDHRCVLYMSEIDMGVTLPDYGVELIRSKVTDPKSRRDLLLRGVKVKADEAVVMGLVNMAYDNPESAVEGAVCMGEELAKRKFNGNVYALIRKSLYPELCTTLGLDCKINSVTKPRL